MKDRDFPSANAGVDPDADLWSLTPREEPLKPAISKGRAFRYWVDYVNYRVSHGWDAVIVIDGAEGSGKSTLGLRLCYALRPDWDASTFLCYSAGDIISCYRKLMDLGESAKGYPILYDEGVRGLLAGETNAPEQRALIKTFMLVREIGAVLIICAPDIWRVAHAIRGRRATLFFHVKERGLAEVFERDERLRMRQDSKTLRLTVSPTAPLLTWKAFAENDWRWVGYGKVKKVRLAAFLQEAEIEVGETSPQGKAERRRVGNAERQARWRAKHRGKSKPTDSE